MGDFWVLGERKVLWKAFFTRFGKFWATRGREDFFIKCVACEDFLTRFGKLWMCGGRENFVIWKVCECLAVEDFLTY